MYNWKQFEETRVEELEKEGTNWQREKDYEENE
jgi:hypothetical protein